MVLKGATRGNGKQLADYLITMNENERIHILDVDGRDQATPEYLQQTLLSMEAMSLLTKSRKGLYHAQINPAYSEDKKIDWFKAADMLGHELGLTDQRRLIVLHEKKGRTHAHVVWERYDYETGRVKSDSFSRLQQDHARRKMEMEFGMEQTPRRNKHRPELKASLLQLWNQTGTGAQFIRACKNNNYMIAQGAGRSPFIVVDENGRSFDLARQLKGVRLKDVRQRLRHETLITEKAAITYMRNQKAERDAEGEERRKLIPIPVIAREFAETALDQMHSVTKPDVSNEPKSVETLKEFSHELAEIVAKRDEPTINAKQAIAEKFAENKQDKKLTDRERLRQALKSQREADRDIQQDRDFGMEWD